ncbi:uncharacterized protein LOC110153848 isoform X2 [Boleophthalmus pectinirostris]|uniref:uncharacterized protein LOC110153848 isoform X2 n=1 Tax=Boleophthalmus pectinirostris TaxID=150288 RepID=UPI0024332A1D|nr:uncharacterized protein LOC110153848 isoform X2 [Boleophthalmus pectinirostris]
MSDGKSMQICHCGWSKHTTYHGLRTHQGKKGCTPRSTPTRSSDCTAQIIFNTYIPKFTYAPSAPCDNFLMRQIQDVIKESESDLSFPSLSSLLSASSNQLFQTETLQVPSLPAPNMNQPKLKEISGPQPKATTEAPVQRPFFGTAHKPLQLVENGSKTRNALDSMVGQQQTWRSQTVNVADVVTDGKENKPRFGAVPAPTFAFASSPSQNIFNQNKQLFSPMSGSFNAPTPARPQHATNGQNSPQFIGRSADLRCSSAVNNCVPSLATTEASVNMEIRPASGASQNIFGENKPQYEPHNAFTAASGDSSVCQNFPQMQQQFGFPQAQLPLPSTSTQEVMFQSPFSSQPDPKTSGAAVKENQNTGFPQLQQNYEFPQTQRPLPFTSTQQAMFQTPSSSQPGPKTFGAAVKENQNIVTPPAANTTGAAQNGQRESHSGPASPKTPPQHEPESYFETPKQNSDQSAAQPNRIRRALNFHTGAAQAQTSLTVPTTTPQTIVPPVEDQKEAEKLQQLQRDKMKAELQQKIRCRDQKLCEIRASVKACEGSLDEEWLEIDNVFSNVIHLVEEARQRALQPIEKRREKLKRESKGLIQKIQEDIVKLENAIKEVDTAADLDAVTLSKLKIKDFKTINVNTDFAFGTLQTTISTMREQIQEEMDKLSALELERAPVFAVDVKLDHSSAHQWLAVSKDGKMVQDGGQCQPHLPVSRGRFELYESIVGASPVRSGRAYWEVQVGAKSGWDLGVASVKANRKGKLTLSPDGGYWVLVHFEGDKYAALTAPPFSVELKNKPQKVGVFLDYEEGLVSFYDVTNQTHIYSFTNCSFDDGMLPYFSPHLKLNGQNAEPLVITEVK